MQTTASPTHGNDRGDVQRQLFRLRRSTRPINGVISRYTGERGIIESMNNRASAFLKVLNDTASVTPRDLSKIFNLSFRDRDKSLRIGDEEAKLFGLIFDRASKKRRTLLRTVADTFADGRLSLTYYPLFRDTKVNIQQPGRNQD